MRRRTGGTVAAVVSALCGLLLVACGTDQGALKVGAKQFAEQRVLAEMARLLLKEGGLQVDPVVECGDTYRCQRALRDGAVDLMIDYSGTGLHFLGAPAPENRADLAQVRKLYKPLGLSWLEPLGFDNGYRLLTSPEKATTLGLSTISDLARRMPEGIRVATPREFLRRPNDGLAALTRRYGLRLSADPVVLDDPGERMQALLSGRADVAVGYATDGAMVGLGLAALQDDQRFFPPYEAAVVTREDTLKRHADLRALLAPLKGRISVEAMQKMNYAVEVGGQRPVDVARRFLKAEKLLPETESTDTKAVELVVAMAAQDAYTDQAQRALRAVSQAFPGRPVQIKPVRDPVTEVTTGQARLAIMGAERFFPRRRRGRFLREERLEAVAALGTRLVHIVRRSRDLDVNDPLTGRVGIGAPESGAAWAGLSMLALTRQEPALRATTPELMKALAESRIDAALMLLDAGDPALAEALKGGQVALYPINLDWAANRVARLPFFRAARLPVNTYPDQLEPLETLAAQVVLAGPGRQSVGEGGGGPAAAVTPGGQPLTLVQVEALAEATRVPEAPDPALPSAWTVQRRGLNAAETQDRETLNTVLNVLVFAFLFWWVRVILHRPEDARNRPEPS